MAEPGLSPFYQLAHWRENTGLTAPALSPPHLTQHQNILTWHSMVDGLIHPTPLHAHVGGRHELALT